MRRFVTGGSDGVVKIWEYRYALLSFYSYVFPFEGMVVLIGYPQYTRQNLPPHQRAHRPHRLGPGRGLGTHNPPEIVHSVRGARQDDQDMDK